MSEEVSFNSDTELDAYLKDTFDNMAWPEIRNISVNCVSDSILFSGGRVMLTIIKQLEAYGVIKAVRYYTNTQVLEWNRLIYNTVWSSWDWVNPPMVPGVEYRTTERWQGKPIYTKLIDCGALPSVGTIKNIALGNSGISNVFLVYGTLSSEDALPYKNYATSSSGTTNISIHIDLSCTKSNIKLSSVVWNEPNTEITSVTAIVQIKYTK